MKIEKPLRGALSTGLLPEKQCVIAFPFNEFSGKKAWNFGKGLIYNAADRHGAVTGNESWSGGGILLDGSSYLRADFNVYGSGLADAADYRYSGWWVAFRYTCLSVTGTCGIMQVALNDKDSNPYFFLQRANATSKIYYSGNYSAGTYDLTVGQTYDIFVGVQYNPTTFTSYYYLNGNLITTRTGSPGGNLPRYLWLNSGYNGYANGIYHYCYAGITKILTQDQIRRLHENPYQTFDPVFPVWAMYAEPTAGGLSIPRPFTRPFYGPLGGI